MNMGQHYIKTIQKYDEVRTQARELAKESLPKRLQGLILSGVDNRALSAFRVYDDNEIRLVNWDWTFANRYCKRHPKAFDLSVWHGNSLCSLSLGRPTYHGTEMRLDFVERITENPLYTGEMFGISLIAYEAYGKLIGATKLRLMNPLNEKLIQYYSSHGGFKYVKGMKGNPHYLVKSI